MRKVVAAAILSVGVLASTPATASAQVFITPFAGATFGADAPASKLSFGGALTLMGNIAGVELEVGYTPDFFDSSKNVLLSGSNNITSLMGSLMIGVGAGPVRPYLTGGAGLLRSRVRSGSALFNDVNQNDFGLSAGVGLITMFSDHIGARLDGRYFRSLRDSDTAGALDISVGNFDFWRVYGGLTFKF
jgi:opacity protein-like surface antigen